VQATAAIDSITHLSCASLKPPQTQTREMESPMSVSAVLFLAWIVVMTFWMVNHFYRQNQKYEMEYRQGKHPRWEKPDDYDEN
jgi:hypothetical protein